MPETLPGPETAPNGEEEKAPEPLPPTPEAEAEPPDIGAEASAVVTKSQMDELFAELSEPEGDAWRRAEADILRIWSRSGSAAMDYLYKRGEEALDAGDYPAAIGHLTALTDHAPDFAAGFQLRAAAYYMDGELGPAAADLARVLQIEPRQFGALTQLGAMLEDLGSDAQALAAYRASLKINPHQQEAVDAVTRLEEKLSGTEA